MKWISLIKFIELYANGDIQDPVVVKNKIYGRTGVGAGDEPKGFIVVYSDIPP